MKSACAQKVNLSHAVKCAYPPAVVSSSVLHWGYHLHWHPHGRCHLHGHLERHLHRHACVGWRHESSHAHAHTHARILHRRRTGSQSGQSCCSRGRHVGRGIWSMLHRWDSCHGLSGYNRGCSALHGWRWQYFGRNHRSRLERSVQGVRVTNVGLFASIISVSQLVSS